MSSGKEENHHRRPRTGRNTRTRAGPIPELPSTTKSTLLYLKLSLLLLPWMVSCHDKPERDVLLTRTPVYRKHTTLTCCTVPGQLQPFSWGNQRWRHWLERRRWTRPPVRSRPSGCNPEQHNREKQKLYRKIPDIYPELQPRMYRVVCLRVRTMRYNVNREKSGLRARVASRPSLSFVSGTNTWKQKEKHLSALYQSLISTTNIVNFVPYQWRGSAHW